MPIDSRSRVEDILNVILGNLDPSVLQPPQSRVEALLQRLNEMISDFDGKIPVHICTYDEYDHETLMPTIEDPEENAFYLVPANESGDDMYIEWIFTESNRWERFGSGGGTVTIEQSDWNQNDSSQADFIKNKPDLSLKLDKNQGFANHGRVMTVNSSGVVVPAKIEGGNITVTETLETGEDYSLGIEGDGTGGVSDVKVGGATVVNQGVANIPLAGTNSIGAVKIAADYGLVNDNELGLKTDPALAGTIKTGLNTNKPIVPSTQHNSVFYGLAKAAGDSTQSSSANTVGTYTDAAKDKILSMLGVSDLIAASEGSTASKAYSVGEMFIFNGKLHEAIDTITIGDAIVRGINCDVVLLGDKVTDLKSQTNANTFDINILKSYHKSDLTYDDISKIVKAGAAADWFEIGDQIVTTWSPDGTTNYDMPWDVVDIAPVVNADGDTVPGLWLESHWALPGLQFDASEAIYVATETMPSGTYYFTIGTTWGSHCVAGKSYSFTTTQDIPAGGQIVIGKNNDFYTWGAPDQNPANWRAHTFSDATSITPLDTNLILTEGATGVSLGTIASNIQAGTTNPNNLQRAAYGYNRYSQSAMRQWLNSDAAAGAWWTAQNVFDRPAQQVATMRGFMAGLPTDFLTVINPVKVSTALNTVSDGGGVEDVYDRFFLASLEQEYIVPQLAGAEGSAWEYWKQRLDRDTPQPTGSAGANANHIRYGIDNHNTAYTVRLRSAHRGSAYYVWYVTTSGAAGSSGAPTASRPALACVIC